jgi:hypothetical protein
MKIFGYVVLAILGLALLTFGANEFSIFGTKFWDVRKENARREVFEQSQSYVEGKRQELIKLHHEWNKASVDDRVAIEATIRMSFANFDENKIQESELYSFLYAIKYK